VLFEFLPGRGDAQRLAEAVIRVFHRLGDYKHKQRNRLKFLVRSLGWDGFRAEFERELEAFRRRAARRCRSIRSAPPVEEAPARGAPPPTRRLSRAWWRHGAVTGPGITPRGRRGDGPRRVRATGSAPTCARRSSPATRSSR
jgi:sulfite reductase beta subunit-like hemoprotein